MPASIFELRGESTLPEHIDLYESRKRAYSPIEEGAYSEDYLLDVQRNLDELTIEDHRHLTLESEPHLSDPVEIYHYVDVHGDEMVYRTVSYIAGNPKDKKDETYIIGKQVFVGGELQYERYVSIIETRENDIRVQQSTCYPDVQEGDPLHGLIRFNETTRSITAFDIDYLNDEISAMFVSRDQDY